MEKVFQDCELTARDDGRTVLLSSHILSEVEGPATGSASSGPGGSSDSGSLADLRHLTRTRVHAVLLTPLTDRGRHLAGPPHDVAVDGDRAALLRRRRPARPAARHPRRAAGSPALTCQPPTPRGAFLARYQRRPIRPGSREPQSPQRLDGTGMTAAAAPPGGRDRWTRSPATAPARLVAAGRAARSVVVLAVGSAPTRRLPGRGGSPDPAEQPVGDRPLRPARRAHRRRARGVQDAHDGGAPHRGARLRRRAPAHAHGGGRGAPRAPRSRRRRPVAGAGCRRHPGDHRRRGRQPAVRRGAGVARHGPHRQLAFGVAWMAAGLAMVGVTAVAVQLASTTRGAAGLGFGVLGAVYVTAGHRRHADPGTFTHARLAHPPRAGPGRSRPTAPTAPGCCCSGSSPCSAARPSPSPCSTVATSAPA